MSHTNESCHSHLFFWSVDIAYFSMRVKCHVGEQRHTLLTESGALLLECRALLTENKALLAGYILCGALLIEYRALLTEDRPLLAEYVL